MKRLSSDYFLEGFLALQTIVTYILTFGQLNLVRAEEIFMKMVHMKLPIILMCRFPHESWIKDPLLQPLINFTPLIIILSFVYSCINTVRVVTIEKENQLKVSL